VCGGGGLSTHTTTASESLQDCESDGFGAPEQRRVAGEIVKKCKSRQQHALVVPVAKI
jgi:hypothetical protein